VARNTPKMKNGELELEEGNRRVALDSPDWFKWLGQAYSFSYETPSHRFTLHRRDHGGCQYWYAYRRKEGRLKTCYAGKTADLSRARLEQVALQFEGKDKPEQAELSETGLFLPVAPSGLLPRARLLEKLATAGRFKLILVIAPAGYGKTTLLAEWARTGSKQVAWISLEEVADDPARFSAYLTAALEPLIPVPARDRAGRFNLPSVELKLATFLEAAARLTGDIFLVLDDCHSSGSDRLLEQISSLLLRLPPHLHLIISGQSLPPIPLGRLRAKGQVLELKTTDLCFTTEETEEFFNTIRLLNLSREQVRRLWEQSEGWVTALQLAALSLQGLPENRIADFILTFGGSQPYVFEYLGEEVLSRQPEEMQRFLLDSSILSRVNAALLEYVTGQTGAQEKLARLEKENLFIVPLDGHREWYRYHHLFGRFLQIRQRQKAGAGYILELHRRAAGWYVQHNMAGEAIKHLFAAGNFEEAAVLVAAEGRKLLVRGEIATLLGWLETLPPAIVSTNPELALLYTWVLALGGRLEETEARFIRFEKTIPPGEAQALRLVLLLQQGDMAEIQRAGVRTLDHREEPDPFIRSVQALVTGLTQKFFGDSLEANRAYLTSSLFGQATGNTLLVQVATAEVGDILFLQGQLHRAAATYRQALALFPGEGRPVEGFRATTLVNQGYALVLYEWDQLADAAGLLEEAIQLTSTFAYHLVAGVCLAQLAQVRAALGDHQGAQEAMVMATEAVRNGPAWLAGYAGTILAWVNLKLGNLDQVRTWSRAFPARFKESGESTPFRSYIEMSQAVYAKLCLKEGKIPEALALLERLEPEASRRNWVKWLLEIQTLRAAALLAVGKERAALSKLKKALADGEKEGFIRSFADHNDVVGDLLVKASENLTPTYRHKLLVAAGRTETFPGGRVSLSQREREVLILAARGGTNEEIARELMVGVSTVKTHLLHIYGKLEVRNRSQAAARARELGLM
jgi:LuxR family maltose regulon positive regulatory protein